MGAEHIEFRVRPVQVGSRWRVDFVEGEPQLEPIYVRMLEQVNDAAFDHIYEAIGEDNGAEITLATDNDYIPQEIREDWRTASFLQEVAEVLNRRVTELHQQTALAMADAGMSVRDIAHELEISPTRVQQRLKAARAGRHPIAPGQSRTKNGVLTFPHPDAVDVVRTTEAEFRLRRRETEK